MNSPKHMAQHHPCHYSSPPLRTSPSDQKPSLLDCRISPNEPTLINGVHVFFTNEWRAARFLLLTNTENAEGFTATPADAESIFNHTKNVGQFSFTVDPCAACGFYSPLESSSTSTLEQVNENLRLEIALARSQQEAFLHDASEILDQGDAEQSYEILRVLITHLDCSEPQAHYLMGLCGIELLDPELLNEALKNLTQLSPELAQKLEEVASDE
jgi:hypothetical protein